MSHSPHSPMSEPTATGFATPKRPYEAPRLIELGDLRTLTLGPSPGIGESGNPALFKSR